MSGKSKQKAAAVPSGLPASPAGEMPEVNASHSLKSESRPAGLNDRWLVCGVCIFLAAITFAVFGQTLRHEFVNFDDSLYVYENPAVTRGLNLKGVEWAFTHTVCANWHPLTMMSHMLDCQLYGLKAGGHHMTNVLLHTASAILLFLVLRQMTGKLWRNAFVAAVFAIHPLRVESVAWVAERKDVLSGLFFMLTLWAYARYAQGRSRVESRESSAGPSSLALDPRPSTLDYGLVLLFFALGLMCKPMLVTLPLVLLLLDYWPLGRVAGGGWRGTGEKKGKSSTPINREQVLNCTPNAPARDLSEFGAQLPGAPTCRVETERRREQSEGGSTLLLEKLPLLGLAVASGVVTIFAQKEVIQSFEKLSLPLCIGNASISCVTYLGQMFWPSGLAVLYPLTARGVGVSGAVLSLVLLAGISGGVFVLRRRRPYFLTGWLWYLIMLTPVIGIVQVGAQARADRYTYLPQIGLYLLLTWAAAELCVGWRHRRLVLVGGATVILVALIFCARAQTVYWRNSESLWTHTLACTSDNFIGHSNLGNALLQKGKVDEALVHYQQALQIKPDSAETHNNLGNALLQQGKVDEAIAHWQQALQIKPDFAEAHNNLGNALLRKGQVGEATAHCQQALQIKPDFAEAHNNLAMTLLKMGRVDEAIAHFQQALQIKPDYAEAHNNLGNVLLQQGSVEEAITHYQKALQIKPDYANAHINLGIALFKKGRVDDAIVHFQKALQVTPDNAKAHNNLGSALLQKGKVDEAIAQYQQVLQIKPDSPNLLNNLAWLLATCPDAHIRDGVQAVKYAERACELTHYGAAPIVGTLAAAYAEAGRYDDAIAAAQKACALATAAGEQELLEKNQKLLVLYRARQPYHEAAEEIIPATP
jgi:tetratricopeptide (TPR) repeat protein